LVVVQECIRSQVSSDSLMRVDSGRDEGRVKKCSNGLRDQEPGS
jgi:hypothetical protein